jgi:hypothetical protein
MPSPLAVAPTTYPSPLFEVEPASPARPRAITTGCLCYHRATPLATGVACPDTPTHKPHVDKATARPHVSQFDRTTLTQPALASPTMRALSGRRGGVHRAPNCARPFLLSVRCACLFKAPRTNCLPCHRHLLPVVSHHHRSSILERHHAASPPYLTGSRPPCAGHGAPPYAVAALGPIGLAPSSPEHRRGKVVPPP